MVAFFTFPAFRYFTLLFCRGLQRIKCKLSLSFSIARKVHDPDVSICDGKRAISFRYRGPLDWRTRKASVMNMRIRSGGRHFRSARAQSGKLVFVVVLVLRSKAPYYLFLGWLFLDFFGKNRGSIVFLARSMI